MIERQIEIATKAGRMNTFVTHPERGGPHPLLITGLLGGAATWLLAAASRRPARTLAVAFLFVE